MAQVWFQSRHDQSLMGWGTYSVTGEQTAGKPDQKIEIKLHLWDGASQPTIINEDLPCDYSGNIPAEQAEAVLRRELSA
jgi:hypothetical protein